jgi:hypothetical protein
VFQEALDLRPNDVPTIFRNADSNLDAPRTFDLGPRRECVLWARMAGPQFAALVTAVVSLVEAPTSHRKATAVAKEAMAIRY